MTESTVSRQYRREPSSSGTQQCSTVCRITLAETGFKATASLDALAQNSQYFAELREMCLQKSPVPQRLRVELPVDAPLSASGIQTFVKYVLGEEISINQHELPFVLQAAVFFQSQNLTSVCEQHLLALLSNQHAVVDALNCAVTYRSVLSEGTYRTVLERGAVSFTDVAKTDKFRDSITLQGLEALLREDSLAIADEYQAYEVALDVIKRRGKACSTSSARRLLSSVRFTLMSTQTLLRCAERAKQESMEHVVIPFISQADWYRTCTEFGRPELSDAEFKPRSNCYRPKSLEGRNAAFEQSTSPVTPATPLGSVAPVCDPHQCSVDCQCADARLTHGQKKKFHDLPRTITNSPILRDQRSPSSGSYGEAVRTSPPKDIAPITTEYTSTSLSGQTISYTPTSQHTCGTGYTSTTQSNLSTHAPLRPSQLPVPSATRNIPICSPPTPKPRESIGSPCKQPPMLVEHKRQDVRKFMSPTRPMRVPQPVLRQRAVSTERRRAGLDTSDSATSSTPRRRSSTPQRGTFSRARRFDS